MHPIVMAVELFLDQHSPKQFCKMSATNTQFLDSTQHFRLRINIETLERHQITCAYKQTSAKEMKDFWVRR